MKKEKSLEEMSLETVRKDKDFRKVFDKWSTYGKYEEPVLIDECQYWKHARGHEDSEFYIMLRCIYKAYGWELSLWRKTEEGPDCQLYIRCSGWQIDKTTKDLWMTSQHLRLKHDDGRNVAWDIYDAYEWWKVVCFHAGMTVKLGNPPERELHYIKKGGDD